LEPRCFRLALLAAKSLCCRRLRAGGAKRLLDALRTKLRGLSPEPAKLLRKDSCCFGGGGLLSDKLLSKTLYLPRSPANNAC
jgi:hypothetical protein